MFETALELLKAARDKISSPDHWIKEVGAKDADGSIVTAYDPQATAWCMYGALDAFTHDNPESYRLYRNAVGMLMNAINDNTPYHGVSEFNDAPETTHADVMLIFDYAIKDDL